MFSQLVRRRLPPRLHYLAHPARSTSRTLSDRTGYSVCPSCSKPLQTRLPACTQCWSISPLPSAISYHDLFGLDEGSNPFVVDTRHLKAQFRKYQSICHPDTWASKGSDKQNVAQSLSSLLNGAYRRMLDPLSRAEYILERNGHPITETDNLTDASFISKVMDARDEISSAENPNTLQNILNTNQGAISDTLTELKDLIGQRDWTQTKNVAIRLKYLQGINDAAQARLDALA